MTRLPIALLPGVALAALVIAGCGDTPADTTGTTADAHSTTTHQLAVVASFYPLQEAAEQIGGDRVQVTNLTPPGGEPHDLDLTPASISALEHSKLALYLGQGFQPAVSKAIGALPSSVTAVDLLDGQQLRRAAKGIPGVRGEVEGGEGESLAGGKDPHVWVDPARFIAIATKIEQALIAADPDGRATYERNADRYLKTLRALDAAFEAGLAHCETKVVVTSHAAFGYLTDRYSLTQAAIAGISPDDEPDPKSLAATAKYAKVHGVSTVFFESLVPKALAQTVASEIGARTDALNPVEGLTKDELAAGASYASIQRDNLKRLTRGLRCTAS
ncbi:MAG: zinc ABC transporter substrate-binding protein [Patulibacter sp.]